MILNKETAKRCGIFLFYDKDGIVDDYIINMIQDLKNRVEYMLVVCNGFVEHEGLASLRAVADDVLCRVNIGFDVGAYREGLFYLGWQKMQEYDELVLLNYTFFGPIFPFAEMFDTMAEKDISFWGPTKHHKVPVDPFNCLPYGYLPEHIQSHFLVLRRELFTSYYYRDFMWNMEPPITYQDSICNYEAIFTKHFADLGFAYDVYVQTDEYEDYAYFPGMFFIKDLMKNKRCPIIKRRSFFTDYHDYMNNTCGEASTEMYEFLQKETDYDLNLIWDNILRLENMTAIHRTLHLNYMLETFDTKYDWKNRIALVVICDSKKRKVWADEYLKKMPSSVEIIYYEKHRSLQNVMDDLKDNNYDYIGIAHVMDVEQEMPYSNIISLQYSDWENLFYNGHLIGNLVENFEENPRMGLCIPPIFTYGSYFTDTEKWWEQKFDQVKVLLETKQISVNVQKNEFPLAPIGGSFWMRGSLWNDVANHLMGLPEDMEVWMLPYIVQGLGYYTGMAYSDRYAPISVTNEDYMLRSNNQAVFPVYGADYLSILKDRIRRNERMDIEETK